MIPVRGHIVSVGRLAGAVCVALVALTTTLHAAELAVSADFDGDGRRDRALLDRQDPSVIRVWLSNSHRVDVVQANSRVSTLTAGDLDGDRRPELIATGTAHDLHIWTRDRGRFRVFGPSDARRRIAIPAPRSLHDTPIPRTSPAIVNGRGAAAALTAGRRASVADLTALASSAPTLPTASRCRVDPAAPRAPPQRGSLI